MAVKPIQLDTQASICNPSQCSCEECDSVSCFSKRYQQSQKACACKKCKNSKTCLYYQNKNADLKESKSDVSRKVVARESYEKETVLCKNTEIITRKHTKYVIRPQGIKDVTKKQNICVLPLCGLENCQADLSTATAELSAQVMDVPFQDFKKSLETLSKESSQTVPKKSSSSLPNKSPPTTPKKSSSILPKKESSKQRITKYDILRRIKEVYKACSCKVCECITNVPLALPENKKDKLCDCKPCDCEKCRKMKEKLQDLEKVQVTNKGDESKRQPIKGCSCMRCIREKCKAAMKDSQSHKNVHKPCDCTPCDCIKCKRMNIQNKISSSNNTRTLIVAPVGEDSTRRGVCQCTPCDCLECGHVFGTIHTSMTHEMSTGISRHRNCRCEACLNEACDQEGAESCRCNGPDKVMRKPVQRDTNDYDIRRAQVSNKNPLDQKERTGHDTIAMFTALPNAYSTLPIEIGENHFAKRSSAPDNHIDCSCAPCECTFCTFNGKKIQNMDKASRGLSSLKKVPKLIDISNACKCAPCECIICTTNNYNRHCFEESDDYEKPCSCEPCECTYCTRLSLLSDNIKESDYTKPIKKFPQSMSCMCSPCECAYCKKMTKYIRPTYNSNLDYQSLSVQTNNDEENSCKKDDPTSKFSNTRLKSSKKSDQNIFIYHALELHNNAFRDNPYNITAKNKLPLHTKYNDAINNNSPVTFKEKEQTRISHSSTENIECQVSDQHISAISSCASGVHNRGTASPIVKKLPNTSRWQSSCNSSGHDHSDYLIRFPATTTETCITEVMDLNADRKISLEQTKANSRQDGFNPLTTSCYYQTGTSNKRNYPIELNHDCREITFDQKCKTKMAGKGCDCAPCDCDRCSFTKLKFKRCHCDCVACNCYGTCLSEDQSVYIRKNQDTQTLMSSLYSDNSESNNLIDRFKRDFTKTNTHIFPLLPETKDFEVSKDKSRINPNQTNFLQPDAETQKNDHSSLIPPESYLNNNMEFLKMSTYINYDSVQKTLREAKQFSLELLQILNKYEKANKEFESISEKLKMSQNLLLSETEPTKYTDNDSCEKQGVEKEINHDGKTDEIKKKQLGNESTLKDQHGTDKNIRNDTKRLDFDQIVKTLCSEIKATEACHELVTEENSVRVQQSELASDLEPIPSFIFNEVCKKISRYPGDLEMRNRYKKYRKLIKRAVVVAKRFNSKQPHIEANNESCETTDQCKHSNKCEESEKMQNVDNSRLNKQSKYLANTSHALEKTPNCRNKVLSEIMKQLDPIYGDSTVTTTTSITRSIENTSLQVDNLYVEKNNPTKSQNLKMLTNKMKSEAVFHVTEASGKEAVPVMDRHQTKTKTSEADFVVPYANKALADLQIEVKKLLAMPQLKTTVAEVNREEPCVQTKKDSKSKFELKVIMSESYHKLKPTAANDPHIDKEPVMPKEGQLKNKSIKDIPKLFQNERNVSKSQDGGKSPHVTASLTCAKNSSEAMKIRFRSVRKVSDHTILVKWEPPKNPNLIQGYELLVDGRAVQKILSPSRLMAVVTCLPHADKVLLTLRTITSNVTHTGQYPSSTIVYHPRLK